MVSESVLQHGDGSSLPLPARSLLNMQNESKPPLNVFNKGTVKVAICDENAMKRKESDSVDLIICH